VSGPAAPMAGDAGSLSPVHAGSHDGPWEGRFTGPAVIRTHALGKRYGDVDALVDVDLECRAG
jgi:hypothetical protein